MSKARIVKRLVDLGCNAKIEDDRIEVDVDEAKIYLEIKENWAKAIQSFYKARQYKYDAVSASWRQIVPPNSWYFV